MARAVTLLVLLRYRYAPLVVDRRQRHEYIAALDVANDGDLGDLVRLFARLEIVALQFYAYPANLKTFGARRRQRPTGCCVRRIHEIRSASLTEKVDGVNEVAKETAVRIEGYLEEQRAALQASLREVDAEAYVTIRKAAPPSDEARWWRRQLWQTARIIDFYTNLGWRLVDAIATAGARPAAALPRCNSEGRTW